MDQFRIVCGPSFDPVWTSFGANFGPLWGRIGMILCVTTAVQIKILVAYELPVVYTYGARGKKQNNMEKVKIVADKNGNVVHVSPNNPE